MYPMRVRPGEISFLTGPFSTNFPRRFWLRVRVGNIARNIRIYWRFPRWIQPGSQRRRVRAKRKIEEELQKPGRGYNC